MPSMFVIGVAVLIAFMSVVAGMMAAARRQYDASGPSDRPLRSRSALNGAADAPPGRLAPIVANAIDEATRFLPRNSSEARAVAGLRWALKLAIDGDFEAEVRNVLDAVAGTNTLHDVRKAGVTGAAVDHVVVAPQGVVVVDSVVRSAKVSVDAENVYVGRGRDRERDPMVDNTLRQMATVVAQLGSIPVHGVIVFQDLLTLPPEIRDGKAIVRSVRLMTPSHLESFLSRPGPVADISIVAAELRRVFESALPPAGRGLRLTGSES